MSALTAGLLNLTFRALGWLFGTFSKRAGEWWKRKQVLPANEKSFSILVAKISGDNAADSNHHSIREAISNAMKEGVHVIGWPQELPLGDGPDQLAHEKSELLARKWLKSKKCDILISGRLKSTNVVSLKFTMLNRDQPAATELIQGPQIYNLPNETMELPAAFIDHLGAAIAANALANIRKHHNNGLEPAVRNIANQLAEITASSSRVPDVQIRARLLGCYSSALGILFDYSGNERDLEIAVEASGQAFGMLDRAEHAREWAKLKSLHGAAVARLGGYRRATELLEFAATEMKDALSELSEELLPWTKINLNLAQVYFQLFRIEGSADNLRLALEVYNHIVTDELRDREPLLWATAQNYFGVALVAMSEKQTSDRLLNQAMEAFSLSLEVWTSEFPLQRAVTLINLSLAVVSLGLRQNVLDWFREAADHLREAQRYISRKHAPRLWLVTQINLGNALSLLGQNDARFCDEAITIYRNLEKTVPLAEKELSLRVSFNLARALMFKGKATENISLLKEGRDIQESISSSGTELRSEALNELGIIHLYLGRASDSVEELMKSKAVFERLSENTDLETSPIAFMRIKMNLGATLREIGIKEGSTSVLRESISAISAALEIASKETSPITWAALQTSLAASFFEVAKREERHASLQLAEDSIANALTVFGPQQIGPSPSEARLLADEIQLFGSETVVE